VLLNSIGDSGKGEKMCKMTHVKVDRVKTLVCSDQRFCGRHGNQFRGKDLNSDPTSGFSTMTIALSMMHYKF
jgi:hypothetical protein